VLCFRNFGVAYHRARYGEGTLAILLDDVNCRGKETSVDECEHAAWGVHNCDHSEDASVTCVDNLDITGKL